MKDGDSKEAIQRVAEYLWRAIPPPPPPQRKAQKSFATLNDGQHVEQLNDEVLGGHRILAGSRWVVSQPSNLGVTLTLLDDERVTCKLTSKDWKARFKRVRRPPKRRKKK